MKVDLHTHILPEHLPDFNRKYGCTGFVQLHHTASGQAKLIKDGIVFREIGSNCWSSLSRIQEMDATGVDVQVLSTVPVMFNYWAEPEATLNMDHVLNNHIADVVKSHPTRFVGLGTLPMQQPELAIQEMIRCKDELGFPGVQIGSHINDWNLDAPELLPFFSAAEEKQCSIFVHPWDMQQSGRWKMFWLPWLVGMPTETTIAIVSMLFGGVFEKFPRLKVCFAHGGGTFPYTFGRIQHGFRVRPDLCATENQFPPDRYIGKFFTDSLVHDRRALQLLVDVIGKDRVVLGTDYPFPLGELHPGELVESLDCLGPEDKVNELNRVNIYVMLMPDDFKSFSKIKVDNHMFNKDLMPSHFKVKEYCPLVFKNLRDRFGVDDTQFMESLTKGIVTTDAEGKTGARLFLSCDKRYFIKTLVSEEVEIMHHILKQYHQYIVECHAQTLLPQYLGMYRVTVNDAETYMVVMSNVFSPRLSIHRKYDLKVKVVLSDRFPCLGSTVDRKASEKERAKELPTFKDNDFVNDAAVINIGFSEKSKFMHKLQKDVEFLSSLHIMDYSLIVGIHDFSEEDKPPLRNSFPIPADLEDEDEDDDGFVTADVQEYVHAEGDDNENGVGEEEVIIPSPPDSPQPMTPLLPFGGELDPDLERFGVCSTEGCVQSKLYFMGLIDVLTKYGMKKRTAQAAKTVKHGAGADISTVRPDQYARRFMEFIQKCVE